MKPDQLIKRRGKLGLIKAGTDLAGVKDWLTTRLGKEFKVITNIIYTEPRSAVGNVSDCRYVSDCRSRGREFDPGSFPYFHGD